MALQEATEATAVAQGVLNEIYNDEDEDKDITEADVEDVENNQDNMVDPTQNEHKPTGRTRSRTRRGSPNRTSTSRRKRT